MGKANHGNKDDCSDWMGCETMQAYLRSHCCNSS